MMSSEKYLAGSLVHAVTNSWYVNIPSSSGEAKYFAICAAHSLLTVKKSASTGRQHEKRIICEREPLRKIGRDRKDLNFHVTKEFWQRPSAACDFAFAPVAALPPNAWAMRLMSSWEPPMRLCFLYQNRFDLAGNRTKSPVVATFDATVSPYRRNLFMATDVGFPGFSGAAACHTSNAICESPQFAGLFVGIADPAIPESMLRDKSISSPPPELLAEQNQDCRLTSQPSWLARRAQNFLGITALEHRITKLDSEMLKRSDIPSLVKATQRRWGVIVPSSTILSAIADTENAVQVASCLGSVVDPSYWLKFAAEEFVDEESRGGEEPSIPVEQH